MVADRSLARLKVVLITGFDPWAVGNGSSMRARRWCDALGGAAEFEAFVIPAVATEAVSPYRRVPLPDEAEVIAKARLLMAPRWRDWHLRTSPLPMVPAAVPAWMGRELLAHLTWKPDVVVAFKMAVAAAAADLALECAAPLVVDLDDDEATLQAQMGGGEAADLERLLAGVAQLATVLTVASPTDAAAITERVATPVMATPVMVVPNVVAIPPTTPQPGPGRAMYVANFDYGPNRASARWLVQRVLPHVEDIEELAVIGPFSENLSLDPPARAYGKVPSLEAHYAAATVVACPVVAGSGTSIKVIEAMAYGRAVVTNSIGARGLDLQSGVHAVVTDHPREFAAALSLLAAVPMVAATLGARGRALVAERYSAEVGSAAMVAAVEAAVAAPSAGTATFGPR